jgi:hypothetical protein
MRLAPAVAIGIVSSMAVGFAGDMLHQAIASAPLTATFPTTAIVVARLSFAAMIGGILAALLAPAQTAKAGALVAVWFVLKGAYVAWRFWSYAGLPYHLANVIVPAVAAIAGARLANYLRRRARPGDKVAA